MRYWDADAPRGAAKFGGATHRAPCGAQGLRRLRQDCGCFRAVSHLQAAWRWQKTGNGRAPVGQRGASGVARSATASSRGPRRSLADAGRSLARSSAYRRWLTGRLPLIDSTGPKTLKNRGFLRFPRIALVRPYLRPMLPLLRSWTVYTGTSRHWDGAEALSGACRGSQPTRCRLGQLEMPASQLQASQTAAVRRSAA